MTDEVLTIKEIAEILKLAEKTVYSMAQRGELPTIKVRGQWRIRRADLERWLDQQPKGHAQGREGPDHAVAERKKRAQEALRYNALVQSWPDITRLARESGTRRAEQTTLFGKETA